MQDERTNLMTKANRMILIRIFFHGLALLYSVSAAAASHNATLAEFLQAGDRAFAQFDNQAACAAYSKVVALDSSNYQGLWKLVRAYVDVGYNAEGEQQARYYFTAARLARRCVALYPDSVESHFFLAVALGRTALKVGGKKKVELSKEIKLEAERTLALDPKHDGAMHVLGRWNYELGNLNWALRAFAKILYGGVPPGGNEAAKTWFEKALALEPNSPSHQLWLGETLIQLKQYEQARAHLQACVNLPNVLWDDAINKKQAERTLKEIARKK